jgi:hypothetical protein
MAERAPDPTELIYVPDASWHPLALAFGLGAVVAGIFVWWPYGAIGALIALVGLAGMIRTAREDADRLPRRQRVTTAVLPPVPPRRSDGS